MSVKLALNRVQSNPAEPTMMDSLIGLSGLSHMSRHPCLPLDSRHECLLLPLNLAKTCVSLGFVMLRINDHQGFGVTPADSALCDGFRGQYTCTALAFLRRPSKIWSLVDQLSTTE